MTLFVGSKTPLYDKGVKLTYLITLKLIEMNPNLISTSKRIELKKLLIHGDMCRIAKRLDISPSTVYQFFSGVNNNPRVLNETLNIIREYQRNRLQIDTFLDKK